VRAPDDESLAWPAPLITEVSSSTKLVPPSQSGEVFQTTSRKGERTMTRITVSRRNLLATGACALVGAVTVPGLARAGASGGQNLTNQEIIRKWYAAWKNKDVSTFDNLLADNFTFTSAAGDDHITKSTFKKQCWDTQIKFIEKFDLERITTGKEDAFVKYLCYTKNGKSFRNVEYLQIRDGKIEAIECYFGGKDTFPSAVSEGM
jgi:ketosteroid isomerase-like protein